MHTQPTDSLVAHMNADFGLDLPLGEGSGQSRDDPVEVTTSDATEAYLAEIVFVETLFNVQNVHWRYLKTKLIQPEGVQKIHQVKFEVKFVEGQNVITETRNFYFDVSGVYFDIPGRPQPKQTISAPFDSSLPKHLGWMHFQKLIDNESSTPGMGVTLNYRSPGSYMGVYIYDKQQSEMLATPTTELVEAELDEAAQNLHIVTPSLRETSRDEKNGLQVRIFADEQTRSLIGLTVLRSCFVKFRITIPDGNERFHVETAYQSMMELINALNVLSAQKVDR